MRGAAPGHYTESGEPGVKQAYKYFVIGVMVLAAAMIIYATVLVEPRCKLDGNPFDCDDAPAEALPGSGE